MNDPNIRDPKAEAPSADLSETQLEEISETMLDEVSGGVTTTGGQPS